MFSSITFLAIPTVSNPSILMLPSIFDSRNKAAINDDLPAPVLPTTPTYTPINKYFNNHELSYFLSKE